MDDNHCHSHSMEIHDIFRCFHHSGDSEVALELQYDPVQDCRSSRLGRSSLVMVQLYKVWEV